MNISQQKLNFDQPVKKILLDNLRDFAALVTSLFDMINDPTKTSVISSQITDLTSSQEPDSSLKELISHLIEKERDIHQILDVACNQHKSFLELQSLRQELLSLTQQIHNIQKSLIDSESLLEQAIKDAEVLLEQYEDSKKSKIDTEDIVKYAHKISLGGVLGSPLAWAGPEFPERPYPTDPIMRAGALGRLSNLPPVETPLQVADNTTVRQSNSVFGTQPSTLSQNTFSSSRNDIEEMSEDTSSSSNSDESS
ncbi:Mediator of RNA polymerase II transcription subunit 4 isoform X1 [Oopsacas minuta]|uniref:Mediator of RNA polymerase II transcription subunit 4 n=1 Tax=Oopsacas minuta TaxID=111878 RepID=A0AAV7KI83_9METZ|nr:Mediator of RNA polymerase II transcription subunit 4 isoform X1 [Oopsacas minuta]